MFDSSASRIAITTSENSLWLEAIFTFAQVDFNRGNANIVTEFEVKTSLSQDWTDVPDQYVDQIANGYFPESNEERIQLGQFTAGNHVIIARATFWDGEVVYANPITITVLPAEE